MLLQRKVLGKENGVQGRKRQEGGKEGEDGMGWDGKGWSSVSMTVFDSKL